MPGEAVFEPPAANRGVERSGESYHEQNTQQATLGECEQGENTPLPEGMAAVGKVLSCDVDFLSVTVSHAEDLGGDGACLLAHTTLVRKGGAKHFGASETRSLDGKAGILRKMQPSIASKRWGMKYECWEFPGVASSRVVQLLAGRGGAKCSRIDVCFDLPCHPDFTADHWAELVKPHHEHLGFKDGVVGVGGVNTRYIGVQSSDKQIRIYRKDLKDPAFAEFVGPTLRVEIVFRADQAVLFWQLFQSDPEVAKLAASSVIHAMTGFQPLPGHAEFPVFVRPEPFDEAQKVLVFVRQNGPQALAWHDAGIDVVALAREAGVVTKNRTAVDRHKERVLAVRDAGGAAAVAALTLRLLRGHLA